MSDSGRAAAKDPPGAIAARARPRLPVDGFLERLRPRDPRVATPRPVAQRVMTSAPRILPLVHVPAELLAPAGHDRASQGPSTVPISASRPAPGSWRDAERLPIGAQVPPSSPSRLPSSAVTTGPGSHGTPARELPLVPHPGDPGMPQTPAPSSHPVRTAGPASGASTRRTGSPDAVPIVRGRPADEHAGRHAARATSTAGAVHLPDRHGPLGTPEADALLAHELVHVAARRRTAAADAATPQERASEERVARAVESEVRTGRRRAPRASSPASPLEHPAAAVWAALPIGSVDLVPGGPALPRPPEGGPPVERPPGVAPAGPPPAVGLVRAPDANGFAAAEERVGQGSSPSALFEVSRAPESPAAAEPPSDEDRQLDQLARLLAERRRDELFVDRERGGGVVDLSRW